MLIISACAAPVGEDEPITVQVNQLSGRLLFSRNDAIWIWEGRAARQLIAAPSIQPAFDPTGERIAYVALRAGASELMIADRTGALLAQLTRNDPPAPPGSLDRVYAAMWAFYPTWWPDGSAVLAAAQVAPPTGDPPADAPLALLRYDLSGQRQAIFADPNAHLGRAVALPSGELIVTRTTLGSDGQQQLYRISGGQAQPVAGAPTPAYDPALSPDGRWLVFAVSINQGSDLYLLPADGGSPVRLTDLGTARAPVFAPDGDALAFLAIPPGGRGFELYLAEITASGETFQLGTPRQLSTDLAIDANSGLSWAR